jgi:enamine deaminase RidA (YjgF/YER057c/UK114 family)
MFARKICERLFAVNMLHCKTPPVRQDLDVERKFAPVCDDPGRDAMVAVRRTIVPAGLRPVYENWRFAPAVAAGGAIYCSGIVGTSPDGEPPAHLRYQAGFEGARSTLGDPEAPLSALVAVRDPEAQFATAFETLDAILGEAGASLADVVEITSYHVGISRHMEAFMRVWARYLREPYPAWTAIGVSELIVPGGLVELRAVAIDPKA